MPAGPVSAEFFDLLSEQVAISEAAQHLVSKGFLTSVMQQLVQQADALLCTESELDLGEHLSPFHPQV